VSAFDRATGLWAGSFLHATLLTSGAGWVEILNLPTRRLVRQESGFDQAKHGLASISTTSARTSATWRWFTGGSHDHGVDLILGGRCRFGRGWLV
jgi:hypothetical protein